MKCNHDGLAALEDCLECRIAELEDTVLKTGQEAMKIQAQFEQQAERVTQLTKLLEDIRNDCNDCVCDEPEKGHDTERCHIYWQIAGVIGEQSRQEANEIKDSEKNSEPSLIASNKQSVQAANPLPELVAAIENLSRIKDGKTLFEGSPTRDPECCTAWVRLNDAMKAAKATAQEARCPRCGGPAEYANPGCHAKPSGPPTNLTVLKTPGEGTNDG